jgi:hypothetical protein
MSVQNLRRQTARLSKLPCGRCRRTALAASSASRPLSLWLHQAPVGGPDHLVQQISVRVLHQRRAMGHHRPLDMALFGSALCGLLD